MNILKYVSVATLVLLLFVAGFYVYIGMQLRRATSDATIGVARALTDKRNTKLVVYDEDSVKSLMETPAFSIFFDEFVKEDTIIIKLTYENKE